MEKNFSFENTGKRMPYQMPNGFLEEMERNVWQEIATTSKMRGADNARRPGIAFRSLVAAAAAATLFIVCYKTASIQQDTNYSDVERAFNNLSSDDQNYMLETYSNDVFLSQADYSGL